MLKKISLVMTVLCWHYHAVSQIHILYSPDVSSRKQLRDVPSNESVIIKQFTQKFEQAGLRDFTTHIFGKGVKGSARPVNVSKVLQKNSLNKIANIRQNILDDLLKNNGKLYEASQGDSEKSAKKILDWVAERKGSFQPEDLIVFIGVLDNVSFYVAEQHPDILSVAVESYIPPTKTNKVPDNYYLVRMKGMQHTIGKLIDETHKRVGMPDNSVYGISAPQGFMSLFYGGLKKTVDDGIQIIAKELIPAWLKEKRGLTS